jgi:hypothetical protein
MVNHRAQLYAGDGFTSDSEPGTKPELLEEWNDLPKRAWFAVAMKRVSSREVILLHAPIGKWRKSLLQRIAVLPFSVPKEVQGRLGQWKDMVDKLLEPATERQQDCEQRLARSAEIKAWERWLYGSSYFLALSLLSLIRSWNSHQRQRSQLKKRLRSLRTA